ncbi:LysR family transcriptional regulator [Bordetella ansorpii]|uniref:LysR family transcriptional regulator n=1 Tax=Bordetella ansorpii TaxID=288768 RepID=A0A157SLU0_9BORD|nr:LysR family transcriptional regulator [Bordetella ansorpii]SAI71382.1 LysR family transcriptional regulator [Bordetella ansorpii]
MFTFKQIEALYWTVRLGTLHAAARKLHTSQSAITKRIQDMEGEFDLALFDRTGHKAVLTSRGHEIFGMARDLLAQRDKMLTRLQGLHVHTGTLRLGITEITAMTWLPAFIRELRNQYPRVALEPSIDMGADLLQKLVAGRIDLAIVHEELITAELDSVRLRPLEFVWTGAADQIDDTRIHTPADIAAMPLLRQSRESGLNRIYDLWLDPHVSTNNIFTINSLIAMAGLTSAGFGISCLPRDFFSEWIRHRRLSILRTSIAPPQSVYRAAYRRDADASFYHDLAMLAQQCCDFSDPV